MHINIYFLDQWDGAPQNTNCYMGLSLARIPLTILLVSNLRTFRGAAPSPCFLALKIQGKFSQGICHKVSFPMNMVDLNLPIPLNHVLTSFDLVGMGLSFPLSFDPLHYLDRVQLHSQLGMAMGWVFLGPRPAQSLIGRVWEHGYRVYDGFGFNIQNPCRVQEL